MAMTCQLAGVAYLALYEELAADSASRTAVTERLEDLGPTTLDELIAAYRFHWRATSEPTSLVYDASRVLEPIDAQHGAMASWLIAPMRSSGDSTELGNRARSAALRMLEATGLDVQDLTALNVAVSGWTVGQVWGTLDRSMPVVPATPFDDEDLRIAYEGLLEHSSVLAASSWSEMAGSAVFMRVGGVTEALRPQPKPNLASSLSHVVRDCQGNLPTSVGRLLSGAASGVFVDIRNAFTHVKRDDPAGKGFSDVHESALDGTVVKGLLRAASCFVCGDMSYKAHTDENLAHWMRTLNSILDELRPFADYVEI